MDVITEIHKLMGKVNKKFPVGNIFLFLMSICLYRFLLPFGDEADFYLRSSEVVQKLTYLSDLENFLTSSACSTEKNKFKVWGSIDNATCTEPYYQTVVRILLSWAITVPLIYVGFCSHVKKVEYKEHLVEDNSFDYRRRCWSLGAILFFPTIQFHLGLFSFEAIFLVLALLVFCFINRFFVSSILVVLSGTIDLGNSVILASFVIIFHIISGFMRFFSQSFVILLISSACALLVASENFFLLLISDLPILGDKAQAILEKKAIYGSYFVDKLTGLGRILITVGGALFMLPSYLKFPLVYIAEGLVVIYFFLVKKSLKKRYKFRLNELAEKPAGKSYENAFAGALAGVFIIVSFVLIFPDYANIKYYVFLLPHFFYFLGFHVQFRKLFVVMYFIWGSSVMNLVVYRLVGW